MTKLLKSRDPGYLSWDTLFMGGLSIIAYFAFWAFTEKSNSTITVSQFGFGLAFAINHPHFLASYTLLYGDFKNNIFRRLRYIFVAAIVPLVLGAVLIFALFFQRQDIFGHLLNAMFFLVGFHYVKQVYGCIIVTSAQKGLYYQPLEKHIIKIDLFTLWAVSWVGGQIGNLNFVFYGIPYRGIGIDVSALTVCYWILGIATTAIIAMHTRKYIKEGSLPTSSGLAALLALYLWFLPILSHPAFSYLIPLFHSLQYLPFVWKFKTNEVTHEIAQLSGEERRRAWVIQFIGYAAMTIVLGALAFEFVPKYLDSQQWLSNSALGSSPILCAFLIFINIHHYFIDNVIWRSDNYAVKKHLFSKVSARPPIRRSAREVQDRLVA